MEARGAQYLVSPEVWQAVQHSMSQAWILLLPQFEQQNRNQGGDLQTHRSLNEGKTQVKQGTIIIKHLRVGNEFKDSHSDTFLVLLLGLQCVQIFKRAPEVSSPVRSHYEMVFRQRYSTDVVGRMGDNKLCVTHRKTTLKQ